MDWLDWMFRLLISAPTRKTVRWPALRVQALEERAIPSVSHLEPVSSDVSAIRSEVDTTVPEPPPATGSDGTEEMTTTSIPTATETPVPSASMRITGTLWHDRNGNGVKDAGEPGLGMVTLKLFEGNTLVGTTTTDPSGMYSFNVRNVDNGSRLPDAFGLKPHTAYRIVIEGSQSPLARFKPMATGQVGGLSVGGVQAENVAGANDAVLSLTTTEWEVYSNFNVAYATTHTIGNLVWHDANNNGKKDAREVGLGGVQLRLLDAVTMQEVARTTSQADGSYQFTGLMPGQYIVEIEASNFLPQGTLFGFTSSTGKPGMGQDGPYEGARVPDPNVSAVDNDDNGTWVDGVVRSLPIHLGIARNADRAIDFGLFRSTRVEGAVFADDNSNGTRDPGETRGLANIRIRLAGPIGTLTTRTDADGRYSFEGIPAGTYTLTRLDTPSGYKTSSPEWTTKSLQAGSTETTNFALAPVVDLRLRQNASSTAVGVGGQIVLTFRVANVGARDATGVVLAVPLPAGLQYVRTETAGPEFDPATRRLAVGPLAAGEELVFRIRVRTLRAGSMTLRSYLTGDQPEEVMRNNTRAMVLSAVSGGLVPPPMARPTNWLLGSSR